MSVWGKPLGGGQFAVEPGQPGVVTAEIMVDPPHQQAQRGGRIELGGNLGGHLGTGVRELRPQPLAQQVADHPAQIPLDQRPAQPSAERPVHALISVRVLEEQCRG
jgi:hypothetical protein